MRVGAITMLGVLAGIIANTSARAQTSYEGKQIRLVIASGSGGVACHSLWQPSVNKVTVNSG